MEQERRQWTRIRPPHLVYVELGADNGSMVRDISETGIGFCAVHAVASGVKISFVFTPDGGRRLEGNAELAWTDVTGKVGGLRFREVSVEFSRQLRSWLQENSIPLGSVVQQVPAAATPMDRMEQPAREPLKELLEPAREGQSKTLRVNAMRIALEEAAPAKKKEPAPRKPLDTPALSYAVSKTISREVAPRLPAPVILEQDRGAARRGGATILRAAGAMFVVMLLVILFVFRQGAGEGLIWLGKKVAGEPRALPIQQSDEQMQTPSPMTDSTQVDTQKEPASGVEQKSVLAPLSTTVPGQSVAPPRTAPPSATEKFPSGTQGAVRKDERDAGLAQFKRKSLGSLPEEEQANLQLLTGLNTQLEAAMEALNRAAQDKAFSETRLSQQEANWKLMQSGQQNPDTQEQQLAILQDQLKSLLTRDTPGHPDVIKLKAQIEDLKKQMSEESAASTAINASQTKTHEPPELQQLRAKIKQDEVSITDLTRRQTQIQDQIRLIQGRVPKELTRNSQAAAGSHPAAIQPKAVTEDKAETVQLLWAEVARGEISAQLALADMYAQGDRVPKNCAQARILLSSAAKKGNAIAVRKLIDLDSQGGGCSNSAPQ